MTSFQKQQKRTTKKLKYYVSIDFLPIRNFYEAKATDDFRWLLKLEDYEELPDVKVDLDEVWERIEGQYQEIVGGDDLGFVIEENTEIIEEQQRLINLQNMVFYLHYEQREEYINDLKQAGYIIKLGSPEDYVLSLKDVEHKLMHEQQLLSIKREELKQTVETGEKVSKKDYMDVVADVRVATGLNIDIDKESIRFFGKLLKSMKNVRRNKKK